MLDYKSLYFQLFHVISDAVEILQQGQMEAERIIIEEEPTQARGLRRRG